MKKNIAGCLVFLFTTFNLLLNGLESDANFCSKFESTVEFKEKHAIVSGQSIIGMLAAAVLAKSGYQVDCFEIRDEYTRSIQWAVRQSLVDELASIDEKLADSFITEVISPIYKGSTHVYANGCRRNKRHDGLERGNPLRLPSTCDEMMATASVAIAEAKVFETFLKKYLQSLPNVHLHQGCWIEGSQIPDLLVIAEGFNSKSRNVLNIPLIPAAEDKIQIAGTLGMNSGGIMLKHWRNENDQIRLTGIIGGAESDSTWIVADIDPAKIEKQEDMDAEFRRLAAEALDLPMETVEQLKISAPTGNKSVTSFLLKQAICKIATNSENAILIGDAVGAGHWSVGGGMQTGSVCHIERLKTLLSDIELGMPKNTALNKYSDAVIQDTKTWIEISAKDESRIIEHLGQGSAITDQKPSLALKS